MNARGKILSFFGSVKDQADFEALYRGEVTNVYNYFRFRLGDNALAEDLTAETFEKAWRHRQKYRHDLGAFTTWLFTIAQRVLVDHYRKRNPVVPLEAIEELHDGEPVEDVIQNRADFTRLTVLLSQLAEHERELVALRYGAGLTNRAIARLTGLSESNVGVLLHRAVQKLRQSWREKPREEREAAV